MAYPRDPIKAEKFANFLESAIKHAGYKSQSEFANSANLSAASVSRMLSKNQYPDIATLKKMAPALKISFNRLMVIAEYLESDSINPDQGPAA